MLRDVDDLLEGPPERLTSEQVDVGDQVRFLYFDWGEIYTRRVGYVADVHNDHFLMTRFNLAGTSDWKTCAEKYRYDRVREYQVVTKAWKPREG